MAAAMLRSRMLEQEQKEVGIASITFNNRIGQKFPGLPIAVDYPVISMPRTSAQPIHNDAKNYYISPQLIGSSNIVVPSQPYELGTSDEEAEEMVSGDIVVHNASLGVKRGKFLNHLTSSPPSKFSHPQSRCSELQIDIDLMIDEEELLWGGVFPLPSSTDVIFSKKVRIKVDELPSWEPHISIDSYHLEDDDE